MYDSFSRGTLRPVVEMGQARTGGPSAAEGTKDGGKSQSVQALSACDADPTTAAEKDSEAAAKLSFSSSSSPSLLNLELEVDDEGNDRFRKGERRRGRRRRRR